jgi:hypothetical protein
VRWIQLGWVHLALGLTAFPVAAADLTRIDRTIRKEPVYQSKPEYCLLVFGPEARDRAWLVIDGDVLYVDRNGNGDLTEANKKVKAIKIKDYHLFRAGTIKLGSREYPDLNVSRDRLGEGAVPLQPEHYKKLIEKNPVAYTYAVAIQVENPLSLGKPGGPDRMTQSASSDSHGLLQFTDNPQEAPIVYFDGPWSMDLHNRPILQAGNVIDLQSGVGTRGLGTGTFAFIIFALIPPGARPQAEFDFPPKTPGQKAIHFEFEIPNRC